MKVNKNLKTICELFAAASLGSHVLIVMVHHSKIFYSYCLVRLMTPTGSIILVIIDFLFLFFLPSPAV